jgi:diguanylate cyclase (GGDEF)-like protein
VLPYSGYDGAIKVADRIQDALISSNFLPSSSTTLKDIKASMGIAVLPYDGTTFEAIIKCAEGMLYKAKQKGENQICVHNHTSEIPTVKNRSNGTMMQMS